MFPNFVCIVVDSSQEASKYWDIQMAIITVILEKELKHKQVATGIVTYGQNIEVISDFSSDVDLLVAKLSLIFAEGGLRFTAGLRKARELLLNTKMSTSQMKVIAFVGSQITCTEAKVQLMAETFNKDIIPVDCIRFGSYSGSDDKMTKFIKVATDYIYTVSSCRFSIMESVKPDFSYNLCDETTTTKTAETVDTSECKDLSESIEGLKVDETTVEDLTEAKPFDILRDGRTCSNAVFNSYIKSQLEQYGWFNKDGHFCMFTDPSPPSNFDDVKLEKDLPLKYTMSFESLPDFSAMSEEEHINFTIVFFCRSAAETTLAQHGSLYKPQHSLKHRANRLFYNKYLSCAESKLPRHSFNETNLEEALKFIFVLKTIDEAKDLPELSTSAN